MLDLTIPEHSYFYGFMLADGNLYETSRNRGRLSLEISSKDSEILSKFKNIFQGLTHSSNRVRDTNFKNNVSFDKLSIYSLEFREVLKSCGFPVGDKSSIVKPPNSNFIHVDFVRGLIDGDGSVGFTSEGIPFIGFTTNSDSIKEYYLNFLRTNLNIHMICNRNKRDGIYNPTIFRNKALSLYNTLYYDNCLCLSRKNVKDISNWINPFPDKDVRHWNDYEIEYILNNTVERSMSFLNRTKSSIKNKLNKLRKVDH